MNHKEQVLQELESLYDPNFKVPPGLFIPLGTRVLVKECSQEEYKTQAGIIISGAASLQNAKIGIVFRIGESVTIPIKIGHKVAYDKFALNGIVHNGIQYTDLMEHQVFSVVPPSNYLATYVPTKEDLRRKDRIDFTKRNHEITNSQIDKIQDS